jgi:hypothetical protein
MLYFLGAAVGLEVSVRGGSTIPMSARRPALNPWMYLKSVDVPQIRGCPISVDVYRLLVPPIGGKMHPKWAAFNPDLRMSLETSRNRLLFLAAYVA